MLELSKVRVLLLQKSRIKSQLIDIILQEYEVRVNNLSVRERIYFVEDVCSFKFC
ncbi:hypothetical protein H1P_5960002 [Hyella patelloides LEGE 07179]|uniref:Uncharacterized protein n=1 Tax=Hyella patelloides LEGE 07179 TaxID=945734 RepID=A0A563W0V8_9CYAN|nr:hypothetical protein H1P_5960002 [Hyella patelloides LEGE 07179]